MRWGRRKVEREGGGKGGREDGRQSEGERLKGEREMKGREREKELGSK